MTEPRDMYLSAAQPQADLQRDYLSDYPMKIHKNASGEVVKIEVIKPTATFVKTFEGILTGQVIVETIVISGWRRKDWYGESDIDGIGDLIADGIGVFLGEIGIDGIGDMAATSKVIFHGEAAVTEYGDVAAGGVGVFHGGAESPAQGDLEAAGVGVFHGEAGVDGFGDVEVLNS